MRDVSCWRFLLTLPETVRDKGVIVIKRILITEIRRFGRVIGIKENKLYEYRKLHVDTHLEVRFFIFGVIND